MSAPTNTIAARAVGALRDSQRELGRAIALGEELHAEAVTLINERDTARREVDAMTEAFDATCNERDAALAELSRVKGALTDLAKRVQAHEDTIARAEEKIGHQREELRTARLALAGVGCG